MKIPEAEVRRSDPRRFVCLFHQGSFDDVPNVWGRFLTSASRQGVFSGREQLVGRYPDDPDITPPGKIRFDVGLLPRMEPPARLEEGLRDEVLPGGLWAVTVHRGSYATLSDTYLRLVGGWFPHTGRALADRPCLELYLNSPRDTREEDLLTEVWAPIEARAPAGVRWSRLESVRCYAAACATREVTSARARCGARRISPHPIRGPELPLGCDPSSGLP